jgi:hypothetical protein
VSTRISRSWSGNNYNYSVLNSEGVDAMWRMSPEDYSINNKRIKLGIIYWLNFLDTQMV